MKTLTRIAFCFFVLVAVGASTFTFAESQSTVSQNSNQLEVAPSIDSEIDTTQVSSVEANATNKKALALMLMLGSTLCLIGLIAKSGKRFTNFEKLQAIK